MKNKAETKKIVTAKTTTKTITLKDDRTTFMIVKLGDQKFSFSMRPKKGNGITPYVLIHHDTNLSEISFVDMLNAKVSKTHEDGQVYDISINEKVV